MAEDYVSKISAWLKSKESAGYSKMQLTQYLVSKGYRQADITAAFAEIEAQGNSAQEYNKSSSNFAAKSQDSTGQELSGRSTRRSNEGKSDVTIRIKELAFFRPTFSKTLLLLVIFFLVVASFFINKHYMPIYGKNNCLVSDNEQEMFNANRYAVTSNADPNILVKQLDKVRDGAMALSLNNNWPSKLMEIFGVSYIYSSGLNMFNPWFPVPCPLGTTFFGKGEYCIDYFTAQTRTCALPVKYLPVPQSKYFVQGAVLIAIIYLVLCFTHWLSNILRIVTRDMIIIIAFLILASLLVMGFGIFSIQYNAFAFFGLMCMALFTLEAFAKGVWKKVWTVIFILMLLSVPFLFILEQTPEVLPRKNGFEYCSKSIMIDASSKDAFFARNNYGMPELFYTQASASFNVCPDCYATCTKMCKELIRSYTLFGNRPSCVCSCG